MTPLPDPKYGMPRPRRQDYSDYGTYGHFQSRTARRPTPHPLQTLRRMKSDTSTAGRVISNLRSTSSTPYRPKPQDVEFIAGGELRLRKPAPVTSTPVTSTVPPSVPAPSNLGPTPIYKRRNKAQNGMITNPI